MSGWVLNEVNTAILRIHFVRKVSRELCVCAPFSKANVNVLKFVQLSCLCMLMMQKIIQRLL